MLINEKTNAETLTLEFQSIGELSDFIEDHTEVRGRTSAKHHDNAEFSFSKATRIAAQGGYWPQGAEKIQTTTIDLSRVSASDMHTPCNHADFVGHRPNVPAHLAGSPHPMWRRSETVIPDRLIKIGVHIGRSYDVDEATIFNRGNAIMSVIDALSADGFAVELWAVWRNKSESGHTVNVDTLVKRADESWSPDSVAFALASAGFNRRVIWRTIDTAEEIHGAESAAPAELISGCLGQGADADLSDFDVSFGYVSGERWTAANSLDKAIQQTRDQLERRATA